MGCVKFPHTSKAGCQNRICLSGRKRREIPIFAWAEWLGMEEVKVSACINRQQTSPSGHTDPQLAAVHLAHCSGLTLTFYHSDGSVTGSEPPCPGPGLLHPLDPRYQEGSCLGWGQGEAWVRAYQQPWLPVNPTLQAVMEGHRTVASSTA